MRRMRYALLMLVCCVALAACDAGASPSATVDGVTDGSGDYLVEGGQYGSMGLVAQNGEVAVVDGLAWYCKDGRVIARDLSRDSSTAELPYEDILGDDETMGWQSIVSWGDQSALLCLDAVSSAGTSRVELLELGIEGDAIVAQAPRDATEALGFLFAGDDAWLEVNMIAHGQRLFFAALDADFQVHFQLYDPTTGEVSEKGTTPLAQYLSIASVEDGVLVVGPDDEDEELMNLSLLKLSDGTMRTLRGVAVDSAQQVGNVAYDASTELLYYTLNNIVYAVQLTGDDAPQAVGRLAEIPDASRFGALVGSLYVCRDQEGELQSCAVDEELDLTQLVVADASDADVLTEAAGTYGIAQSDYVVSVHASEGGEEIVEKLKEDPDAYDVFVVQLGSDAWSELLEKGYVADLSGSQTLSALASGMPARMRSALGQDEGLLALPIEVSASSHMMNAEAMSQVTGIAYDELPTDWGGFLAMLAQLAKDGSLVGNEEYSLYDGGTDEEQVQAMILQGLLQDACLWKLEEHKSADDLEAVLTELLQEFGQVDWTRLGLDAAASQDSSADSAMADVASTGAPLLMDVPVTGEVMNVEDGAEIWPLSLEAGGDRRMPQTITVACANARSDRLDAAIEYLEHVCEAMDPLTRIAVSEDANDPVVNEDYEEDCAYAEELIAEYEQELAAMSDAEEKAMLEAELEDLRDYAQRYEQNAKWSASEESIAAYRSLEPEMVAVGSMVWDDQSLQESMFEFLEGRIEAVDLVAALAEWCE